MNLTYIRSENVPVRRFDNSGTDTVVLDVHVDEWGREYVPADVTVLKQLIDQLNAVRVTA